MCEKSRSLRQEELDGFWRLEFVKDILKVVEANQPAKFVVFGSKSHTYRLVEIKQITRGEWTMSISGLISCYTYSYSALVDFIEKVWEKSTTALKLDGEVPFTFSKPIANEDAEPSVSEKENSDGTNDKTQSL